MLDPTAKTTTTKPVGPPRKRPAGQANTVPRKLRKLLKSLVQAPLKPLL